MYVSASGSWDALRPFKMEEPSPLPEDSRITEPHLLEELLDILLHINSPFICVRSLFQLSEADATVYHPHNINYHPALGEAAGLVQKLCGKLSSPLHTSSTDDEKKLDSFPIDGNYNMVEEWTVLWQAVYDLNRFGILPPNSTDSIILQEASLTAQALSYALNKFLEEHYRFVILLEEKLRQADQLSLQSLWFHLQTSIETHTTIAKMARNLYQPGPYNAIQSMLQGSAIFRCLYSHFQRFSGNQHTRETMLYLMKETAKPYLRILSNWMYEGALNDPYEEFLVEERDEGTIEFPFGGNHRSIQNFWDKRFSLRTNSSLCLVEGLEEKILGCGKYLHLLHLFEQLQASNQSEEEFQWENQNFTQLEFNSSPRYYSQLIEKQFLHVSTKLFLFLMNEEKILKKLRLLKSNFVMDRCDVYICFLQTAQADLQRKNLNLEKLTTLLDISQSNAGLSNGSGRMISFHVSQKTFSLFDDAKRCMDAKEIKSFDESCYSLPGILLHEERVTLDWKETEKGRSEFAASELSFVGLNTVVGDKETLQYQLIHRYRVLLLTVHIHLSHARLRLLKSSNSNLSIVVLTSKVLNKMQNFVQNFNSYVSYGVIRRNWNEFEENAKQAKTIDEFLLAHATFLSLSLTQSLLSIPESLCIIIKIMETCLSLAKYVNMSYASANVIKDDPSHTGFLDNVQKHHKTYDIFISKLKDSICKREAELEENATLLFQLELN